MLSEITVFDRVGDITWFNISKKMFLAEPAESSLSSSNVFGLDHHHPHREVGDNSVPSLILYAQAGTRSFGPAHQLMSSLASQGKIDYVLRSTLCYFPAKMSIFRRIVRLQQKTNKISV